jgi:enoyl-CoA hydratase/3-hydroxyacyl-CoA dehydrogenase
MNALNEAVVASFETVFEHAAADPSVRGIVLQGAGKAFVAGADIGFFIQRIQEGDLGRIQTFTERGQKLLRRIETCPKPVVALADGLTLGGGAELALACHAMVATENSRFSFPETSIGIYPGLGGTQRTPRVVGRALARYLVLSGAALTGAEAHEIGFAGYYAPSGEAAALARGLALQGGLPDKFAAKAVPAGWEAVVAAFGGSGVRVAGESDDPRVAKAAKALERNAPIALGLASRFIDEGLKLDLDAALRLELDNLKRIFSTADALEGLTALGVRKPEYKGA